MAAANEIRQDRIRNKRKGDIQGVSKVLKVRDCLIVQQEETQTKQDTESVCRSSYRTTALPPTYRAIVFFSTCFVQYYLPIVQLVTSSNI